MKRGYLRVLPVTLLLCSILGVPIVQAAENPLPQSSSQPQVAGLTDFIAPQPADAAWEDLLHIFPAYTIYKINAWVSKKLTGKTPIEHGIDTVVGAGKATIKTLFEEAVYWLAYWLAHLGNYLLHKVASLVGLLLGAQKFITNPLVIKGWPFVQGVANLGFILALIFIALTVVLRLDNYNVKKLIPRLFLAALLVNFSLLIGGVLIDLSRVLMAVMVRALGGSSIENIAVNILLSSKIFTQAFQLKSLVADGSLVLRNVTKDTLGLVVATVFIWGLLGAFFTLLVGLFMRYIMLILLLIVSPLAYLALAFPGMGSLATRWWKEFIKYVFYGPIVMFVLVLLVGVTNNLDIKGLFGVPPPAGAPPVQQALEAIVSVTIVIVMLIAAATVGKQMGVRGSDAAVGFATGTGKRLGRLGARGLYATTAPARWAGGAVKNQARDALGVGKSALRDYAKGNEFLKKYVVPAKRDEKGNLKPGEKSFASNWADKYLQPQGKKKQQRDAVASLMASDFGVTDVNIADLRLAAPLLSNKHVIDGLGEDSDERFRQVKAIIDLGSMSQIKSLFKNNDYLRSLDDDQRNELQLTLENKQRELVVIPPPPNSPPGTLPTKDVRPLTNIRGRDKAIEDLINAFAKIDEK